MAIDTPAGSVSADTQRLHEMGYAQELNRKMGWFSNFAISFSIISILAGGMTGFYIGLQAGGPKAIVFSWFIVGFFALLVGMAMAEIVSVYPTAGGLYYWSAKLARKNGPMWSWYTGWFNMIGQIGTIASVDYALATFTGFFITLYRPSFGLSGFNGARNIFIIFCLYLIAHGLLNTFRVDLVAKLGDISVWWHVIGVLIIFAFLFLVPSQHQSLSFMFKSKNLTGWSGPFAGVWVFGLGLLLAQYTITGFDASAHVSEETHDAGRSASVAIVRSIYISAIAALVLDVALLRAMPKGDDAYSAIALTGINAAPAIIQSAIGGAGAKLLIFIAIVGQFFCGMACVTANSRMIYAFSRDGAVPGHKFWHRINPKTRTPTNSVWLGVVLSAIVGASSLYQNKGVSVAFFAMTGICVVGLYIAYVIPRVPASAQPGVQAGCVAPRSLQQARRLYRDRVGIRGLDILLLALLPGARLPPGSPLPRLREQLQLGRTAHPAVVHRGHDLVVHLGEELVHRPEGPGQPGRAHRHRARARIGRRRDLHQDRAPGRSSAR